MGLVSLLAVQPVFFFNFIRSMVRGRVAGANPWRQHARVVGPVAASARQLRGTAGGLPRVVSTH